MLLLLREALPDACPALTCTEPSSASCSFIHSLDKEPGGQGGAAAAGVEQMLPSSGCSEATWLVYTPSLWPCPLLFLLLPPFLKGPLPLFRAHCMSAEPSGGGPVAVQRTGPLTVARQRPGPHPRLPATCPGGSCICWDSGEALVGPHLHPPMAALTLISLLGSHHRTL